MAKTNQLLERRLRMRVIQENLDQAPALAELVETERKELEEAEKAELAVALTFLIKTIKDFQNREDGKRCWECIKHFFEKDLEIPYDPWSTDPEKEGLDGVYAYHRDDDYKKQDNQLNLRRKGIKE